MPIAGLEVLKDARQRRYGILSLLAGNLDMVIGYIRAAEEKQAPVLLAYTQSMTPKVPMELAYYHMISWAIDYFHTATRQLMDLVGCSGAAANIRS